MSLKAPTFKSHRPLYLAGFQHITNIGVYGFRHKKAASRYIYLMIVNRFLIRQFIRHVKWASVSNLCYLLTGRNERREHNILHVELNRMMKTKNPDIRLNRINHEYYSIYKLAREEKNNINRQHPLHEIRLRDCLGKYFHGKDFEGLSVPNTYDAHYQNICFEFDNGNMSKDQLIDKIKRHYTGKGIFQVIFWMATAEYAHWKTKENIKRLENNRLIMLFDILKETMKEKPNRILGASYSQFLEDGKLFNMRREAR